MEDQALLEDWVTCIQQEEGGGRIWIGYRQRGVEARSPESARTELRANVAGADAATVRAILLPPKSPPLIAVYDNKNGGLKTLENADAKLEPTGEARKEPAKFPTP